MRSSTLILSLTLILSIQFISVRTEDAMLGTWRTPNITSNNDIACCIPTSLTISESASIYTATYKYQSNILDKQFNAKCSQLFTSAGTSGTLSLVKQSNGTYQGQKNYLFGYPTAIFNYKVIDGKLNVASPKTSSYTYNTCNFTMTEKDSPSTTSTAGTIAAVVILLVVLAGLIAFKSHQKKQAAAITKQNTATINVNPQPNPLNNFAFNPAPGPVYMAPNMYPNQQFVQAMPQPVIQTYPQANVQVFPQQYAQGGAQMNMNFGAPGQVNMNMNGNGGFPQ